MNPGIFRNCDFVVDGNIPEAHIINSNAVSVLPNGRIFFEPLNVVIPLAHKPGVAYMNFAGNGYRAGRTASDDDVAGVGENFQIDGPGYLVTPLEASLNGC